MTFYSHVERGPAKSTPPRRRYARYRPPDAKCAHRNRTTRLSRAHDLAEQSLLLGSARRTKQQLQTQTCSGDEAELTFPVLRATRNEARLGTALEIARPDEGAGPQAPALILGYFRPRGPSSAYRAWAVLPSQRHMMTFMHLPANLTRTCVLVGTLVAVFGATVADAATSIHKVSYQSAVTTLNDGSAAEQAFIFSGLANGRDLTRWQTGRALRNTLEAAAGPGGHALKVSLARPPSPQHGIAGVIYTGLSTKKQLDLATYTSNHEELQIIVLHTPILS